MEEQIIRLQQRKQIVFDGTVGFLFYCFFRILFIILLSLIFFGHIGQDLGAMSKLSIDDIKFLFSRTESG